MDDDHGDKNLVLDILYQQNEEKLIPENDKSGNIEYKLRLDKKDMEKRENMVSQMLWRMNEGRNQYGRYEAHYILGIHDDGSFSDISETVLTKTIHILKSVTKKANAKTVSEKIYVFPKNKMIAHIMIRSDNRGKYISEYNVMIMGSHRVGKSSLMGRLTYGQKDDGNGFSRKLVLRHVHEKKSGITSCPKYDTIGFSGDNIMNYSIGMDFNLENIYNSSDKLINLIDIPGYIKYIKTILYSVSSTKPNQIIICIPCLDVNDDVNDSDTLDDYQQENINSMCTPAQFIMNNKELYILILSLILVHEIDPLFVFTKVDLIDESYNLQKKINQVMNIFNEWQYQLMSKIQIDFHNCSHIKVSNITDEGYNELIDYLNKLETIKTTTSDKDVLFIVNDTFKIPDTGHILHGTLRYGTINVNDTVHVLCHGLSFKKRIKSIHRKTLDVEKLIAGETGSITFYGKIDKEIDKTAVIVGNTWNKKIFTKTKIKPYFENVILKSQQYLLFVDNNIVSVLIKQNENTENEFELTCTNSFNFVLDTDFGVLKDEMNNFYFIRFV